MHVSVVLYAARLQSVLDGPSAWKQLNWRLQCINHLPHVTLGWKNVGNYPRQESQLGIVFHINVNTDSLL